MIVFKEAAHLKKNKMRYRFFNILFLAFLSFSSCKGEQAKNEPLTEQTQCYLADFDEFVNTLTETHPAVYKFISQPDFNTLAERLRGDINNTTTKRDFIWKLSEVIASIGCSHTSLGFFNQQSDLVPVEDYFPLQVRWIENKLYVIDAMINNNNIEKGQEITAINNIPVLEIIKTAFKHINSQAYFETARKEMFNAYATTYIPYVLDFPKTYTVTINKDKFSLSKLKEKPVFPPMISPKSACQETLCLNEIDYKTALLTIRSFAYYGEKTPIIIDFLDNAFKDIKQKNYKNLIIDVRGNFGGTAYATIRLLKHTMQKPFQYFADDGSDFGNKETQTPFENNFNGKIILLTSGFGNSSVGHLASIYKDKKRVIFVGEDLGSNQFCTANQKQFQLTNTQIKYTVGQNIFFTDVRETDASKAIKPDYEISQSIDDYLADKDVVLEFAEELVKYD